MTGITSGYLNESKIKFPSAPKLTSFPRRKRGRGVPRATKRLFFLSLNAILNPLHRHPSRSIDRKDRGDPEYFRYVICIILHTCPRCRHYVMSLVISIYTRRHIQGEKGRNVVASSHESSARMHEH